MIPANIADIVVYSVLGFLIVHVLLSKFGVGPTFIKLDHNVGAAIAVLLLGGSIAVTALRTKEDKAATSE